MRRHKQYHFERVTDTQTRVIVIMRKPKPKSYIRKKMYWAWHYKWDHSHYKKFNLC
jgi:hypothetical protein